MVLGHIHCSLHIVREIKAQNCLRERERATMHKGHFTFMQNYSHPCYIYTTFLGEKGTKQFWERIRQWSLHFHAELFRNKNTSKSVIIYTTFLGKKRTKLFLERERELECRMVLSLSCRTTETQKHITVLYFLREKVGSVVTTEPQRKTSHAHWSRQVLSALSCLLIGGLPRIL